MRPSSSFADDVFVRAMLDVEAALARSNAVAGVIPAEHARIIVAACESLEPDPAALRAAMIDSTTPVVALVHALATHVGEPAAGSVHMGATTQDVIDTAGMLIARRQLDAVAADLESAADTTAEIANHHRDTIMAARTLLQHALPTTFGVRAAGWLTGLDTVARRLREVARNRVAVQLGGATGTLASLGPHGPAVLANFAKELDLPEPTIPWHTDRTRIIDIASALGAAAAVVAKIARDIVLLAQTEIAEVHETGGPERGGSSTLPNKRNPVAAISALSETTRTPGLVATLISTAGQHEHERGAGTWQAEWVTLTDLVGTTGRAAGRIADAIDRLEVSEEAMHSNLMRGGDLLLAERIAAALTPVLGRLRAHDLVRAAALRAVEEDRTLHEVLVSMPETAPHLNEGTLRQLLDPATYLGSANAFIDRALRVHQEGGTQG
jgi:3-carboxy-cis,cis-muconate cycloisomerase